MEPARTDVERECMDQAIRAFHQDEAGEWVAELECGHARHVRHDPPWHDFPWITSAGGRAGRIGGLLACHRCDALLQGLCEEGAREAGRPGTVDPPRPS